MFAECRSSDTRQNQSLPSASDETLGKHPHVPRTRQFPWSFAECLTVNTRQTMSRAPHTTVTTTVTPLPRPVPVTTSVTVTSCRVRGVGHSATFCQCRVSFFWLSAKLEKNIFIYPPNFFLCYYSM